MAFSIGVDFGTGSCRAIVVDALSGEVFGESSFDYPSGDGGVLSDPRNPFVARQRPQDHVEGLRVCVNAALDAADRACRERAGAAWDGRTARARVVSVGVDATGSSPLPVDDRCVPLALHPEFEGELDAMVWLWKDHSAHAEAEEITQLARRERPRMLARSGDAYSSEWFWSKALRMLRVAPRVFAAMHTFVEHCDWLPALLCGCSDPAALARCACAAGHKAMFGSDWGGLPDETFLASLSPQLAALRARLYSRVEPAGERAGWLSAEWAAQWALPADARVCVSVGCIDAHAAAVGSGIEAGTLVKIMGTSTCDLMVLPASDPPPRPDAIATRASSPAPEVSGVCGVARDSVLPGHFGIEAGQSAVGDIFSWFVRRCAPEGEYGATPALRFAALDAAMARLRPGECGLLCLDWHNGNRSVLTDARLTGLVVGQTLHTRAHEHYRALVEATAFGARVIIDSVARQGVPVHRVVCTGGLATRSPALMQIYADVLALPLTVAGAPQAAALGAAVFGAAAAAAAAGGDGDAGAGVVGGSGGHGLRLLQRAARRPPPLAQADGAGDESRAGPVASPRLSRVQQLQRLMVPKPAGTYRPVARHSAVYDELYALYVALHDAFAAPPARASDPAAPRASLAVVMKELLRIKAQAVGDPSP